MAEDLPRDRRLKHPHDLGNVRVLHGYECAIPGPGRPTEPPPGGAYACNVIGLPDADLPLQQWRALSGLLG